MSEARQKQVKLQVIRKQMIGSFWIVKYLGKNGLYFIKKTVLRHLNVYPITT